MDLKMKRGKEDQDRRKRRTKMKNGSIKKKRNDDVSAPDES